MSKYFPEPKSLGGRVKDEVDLSHYATKTDLKNATGVDTSKFDKKEDKAISTKSLTKDLTNKFSILNGAKYFSKGIFQNYVVFIPGKSISNI